LKLVHHVGVERDMTIGGWWKNGVAEVRQLAGGCMATREKWRMIFIFELGPYVEMA